jgi:uncharacterized protein
VLIYTAYILLGLLSGFLSGLLGVGGGVVVVPVLISLFHFQGINSTYIMNLSSGTSCAVMCLTAARTFMLRRQEFSSVSMVYKKMVSTVVVGSLFGAVASHYIHAYILYYMFSVLLIILSIRLFFFSKARLRQGFEQSGFRIMGLVIGFFASLLGIGGSSFTVPFLLSRGVELRKAGLVAVTLIVSLAPAACVVYMAMGYSVVSISGCVGYVYWLPALCIGLASCVSAAWGVRSAQRLPTRFLQKCFAILLVFVSLHLFLSH